jgi:hypothetical protein
MLDTGYLMLVENPVLAGMFKNSERVKSIFNQYPGSANTAYGFSSNVLLKIQIFMQHRVYFIIVLFNE